MLTNRIKTFFGDPVKKQILMIVAIVVLVVTAVTLAALYAGADRTPAESSEGAGSVSISDQESGSSEDGSAESETTESQEPSEDPSSENPAISSAISSQTFSQASSRVSSQGESKAPTPLPTEPANVAETYYDSQIGIWYTVWWQDNDPANPYKAMYQHWPDWSRMEPVRGFYSSGDPEIIRTHMSLFNEYGIDYVILDDTNGHGNDAGSIGANIDKIFSTVRGMGSGKAPKLSIALGGEFNNGAAADPYGSRQAEANLIYDRYTQSYSDVYFKWKNKPLLVSYGLVKYQSWDDLRFTVRRATGNVNEWRFSGTPLPSTGIWGWVFNSQVDNPEVYGVVPGFNKGAIQGNTADSYMEQIKRRQGEHYMDMWLEAIKADRETIVITSWNDFAEEPSVEAMNPRPDSQVALDAARVGYPYDVRHNRDLQNGDDRHNVWLDYYGNHAPYWYEEITWAYASLKTTLLDGYYYRETDKPEVYRYLNGELEHQDAMPHGHPVIKIPAGYIDWFFSKNP